MKVISIEFKVYKITNKEYNRLIKLANGYNTKLSKYYDFAQKIEQKYQPIMILEEVFRY